MPETERDNRLTATASRPAAVADAAGLALCQGRGGPSGAPRSVVRGHPLALRARLKIRALGDDGADVTSVDRVEDPEHNGSVAREPRGHQGVAAYDPRRRNVRTLARFPHTAMSHHTPERLRERS
jgi:hypothetical protein